MEFGTMFFASNEDALSDDRYRMIIESAKFADRNYFSSVWVPERHFTEFGCLYPNPAVLQAGIARETQRIRLRAGSVVLPLHDPIRVAEEWAMVDNLSQGRVGIAFATGWNPNDFVLRPEGFRKDRAVHWQAVETVLHLWQGGSVKRKNGLGKEITLKIFPKPVQKKLPFWITAASNPDSFRKAGAMGGNLLTHLLEMDLEQLRQMIQIYRRARAAAGFAPQEGQVSVMAHTFVAETDEIARAIAKEPYCDYLKNNLGLLKGFSEGRGREVDVTALSPKDLDDYTSFLFDRFAHTRGLIGSVESCLPMVKNLEKIGVTEIACLMDFGPHTEQVLAHLPTLLALKEKAQGVTRSSNTEGEQEILGLPTASPASQEAHFPELKAVQSACQEEVSVDEFYDQIAQLGVHFTGAFRSIDRLSLGKGEAVANIKLTGEHTGDLSGFVLPPPLMEAACQALIAAGRDQFMAGGSMYMPVGMESCERYGVFEPELLSFARRTSHPNEDQTIQGDIWIYNRKGTPVAYIRGFKYQELALPSSMQALRPKESPHCAWTWEQAPQSVLLAPSPLLANDLHRILFLGQGHDWENALMKQFSEEGVACTVICKPGKAKQFDPEISRVYECEGVHPEAFHALFEANPHDFTCQRVIYGFEIEAPMSPENLIDDAYAGLLHGFHFLQAILQSEILNPQWIWMLGRQFSVVTNGDKMPIVGLASAPFAGLAQGLQSEFPDLSIGMVDLDSSFSPSTLMQFLRSDPEEKRLAIRDSQIYVPRLVGLEEPHPQIPMQIQENGTYLVTGGTGGIGQKVAAWLSEQGAKKIILVGRRDPGQVQLKVWENQMAGGASISFMATDLSDPAAVRGLFRAIQQGNFSLKGIFHLAGVLADSPFQKEDWQGAQTVLGAKMAGAWHLHINSLDLDLDYFVMFSSTSSWVTLPGQAFYSSANIFLNALTDYRKGLDLPASSINWGPWAEVGHATTDYGRKSHAALNLLGIEALSPENAIQNLQKGLEAGWNNWGIIEVDWVRFANSPLVRNYHSLFARVASKQVEKAEKFKLWEATPQRKKGDFLKNHLEDLIRYTLNMEDGSPIEAADPLIDLGLDSLMGMEIMNKVNRDFGIEFPLKALIDGATLDSMTQALQTELAKLVILEGPSQVEVEGNMDEMVF